MKVRALPITLACTLEAEIDLLACTTLEKFISLKG